MLALPSSQLQAEEVQVAEPPWPCERLFRSLCRAAAAPGTDMVSQASGGAVRDTLGPGRRDPGAAPGLPTALRRGLKGGCTLSPAAPEELLFPLGEVRAGFRAPPLKRIWRLDGVEQSRRVRRQFLRVGLYAPPCTEASGGHPVSCFVTAHLTPVRQGFLPNLWLGCLLASCSDPPGSVPTSGFYLGVLYLNSGSHPGSASTLTHRVIAPDPRHV